MILNNPIYAGCNAWGRTSQRMKGKVLVVPRSEWVIKLSTTLAKCCEEIPQLSAVRRRRRQNRSGSWLVRPNHRRDPENIAGVRCYCIAAAALPAPRCSLRRGCIPRLREHRRRPEEIAALRPVALQAFLLELKPPNGRLQLRHLSVVSAGRCKCTERSGPIVFGGSFSIVLNEPRAGSRVAPFHCIHWFHSIVFGSRDIFRSSKLLGRIIPTIEEVLCAGGIPLPEAPPESVPAAIPNPEGIGEAGHRTQG